MYDNNYPDTTSNTNSDAASALRDNDSTVQSREQIQGQNVYGRPNGRSYYQNTYQGSTYGQSVNGSPYENRSGNYQYGNTYRSDYTQTDQQTANKKEQKKSDRKQRKFGYVKKALVSLSLGLFFGVFAGVGLYGIQYVMGALGLQTGSAAAVQTEETTEAQDSVVQQNAAENAKPEDAVTQSGIHMTDSINTIVADVSEVVKEVMPAIVSINNHYTEQVSFFGQSFTSEADSSGSGIIVGQNDTELLIVTNYHVISDTEKLSVQFVEGSEAEASVKGTDPDMDLAVIAVPIGSVEKDTLSKIAVATLGDSDALVVGEPAIAIGNSLGYGQSVTTGVISALDRTIELSEGTGGTFIQTDAAINPGNSGGALLNMKGEVIGINSNKIGGSAVEGMGYAIPISSASPIIAELMLKETKNKVAEDDRGYLGIQGINVTEYVIETYGMPEGVYIAQVYDNTAAAQAGLRKGDIITEFDGEEIVSMDELQGELEFHAKGDTVELTVMSVGAQGYEARKVQITLGNKVQN